MSGGKVFADALGAESVRIRDISGEEQTLSKGGNPVVSSPSPGNVPGIVISHFKQGAGTEAVESLISYGGYGNARPGFVEGRVLARDAGASATVSGKGATCDQVTGFAYATDTGVALISAGSAYNYYGGGTRVSGYARAIAASRAEIKSDNGKGASAFGVAYGEATFTATIRAEGDGSSARGWVTATTAAAFISSAGDGSTARGLVVGEGSIQGLGYGSSAQGYVGAGGGTISANGKGGLATGSAVTAGSIAATGNGSFATGNAAGATIAATGSGSQQFGVGSNSVNNSARFGVGLRLHHPAALPGALANGDMWSDGTNISIRSAGATQVFNRPAIAGAKAGNVALTNLLTSLAAMGLIVDNTT